MFCLCPFIAFVVFYFSTLSIWLVAIMLNQNNKNKEFSFSYCPSDVPTILTNDMFVYKHTWNVFRKSQPHRFVLGRDDSHEPIKHESCSLSKAAFWWTATLEKNMRFLKNPDSCSNSPSSLSNAGFENFSRFHWREHKFLLMNIIWHRKFKNCI